MAGCLSVPEEVMQRKVIRVEKQQRAWCYGFAACSSATATMQRGSSTAKALRGSLAMALCGSFTTETVLQHSGDGDGASWLFGDSTALRSSPAMAMTLLALW